MSRREYLAKQREDSRFEELDPTPVELPTGVHKPLTLQEEIRRYVQLEQLKATMDGPESESFEEFDDLDEEEPEPDWPTPYVVMDDDGGEALIPRGNAPTEESESIDEPVVEASPEADRGKETGESDPSPV